MILILIIYIYIYISNSAAKLRSRHRAKIESDKAANPQAYTVHKSIKKPTRKWYKIADKPGLRIRSSSPSLAASSLVYVSGLRALRFTACGFQPGLRTFSSSSAGLWSKSEAMLTQRQPTFYNWHELGVPKNGCLTETIACLCTGEPQKDWGFLHKTNVVNVCNAMSDFDKNR